MTAPFDTQQATDLYKYLLRYGHTHQEACQVVNARAKSQRRFS